jgi:SNF2 family DNA or RNA helicase
VAPKGVIGTWYNQELPTHLATHIVSKTVLWQANINQKQQDKLDTLFESGEDLHILIMNVEAFSSEKGTLFAAKFLNCHKTLMAIDESTTIKNPKAKRTKNIIKLSKLSKYRRILTGSPVTKNPLVAGRTIQLVAGFKNLGELSDSVKNFSYRVLKEDCLDLPPKIFMKRTISLTKEQEKIYNQMKKEALAYLNGKVVSTVNVLTQLMRLQQITCGHFAADDGSIQKIKNNRITELMDTLEEIEGKAIIWAHYQYDVKCIIEEIKKVHGPGSVVDYYGLTPQDQRQKNRDAFQNDSKVRFFVGTPQTGGYGITLTQAHTVIYYSNGYDLEKRIQSEDRAHRIGQTKPVTYVDIIAEETVDNKIVKSLRKKVNIASEVMGEELKAWI